MKMKKPGKVMLFIIILILAGLYYYIALPAINIHNPDIWRFLIYLSFLALLVYTLPKLKENGIRINHFEWKGITTKPAFRILTGIFLGLGLIYGIGSILSSPVINASKYQKLLTVKNGEFTEDIAQISYDQIPLLDRASAEILGERKMGSLVDLASQFEVADEYSQINYQDQPVRVTPLRYASIIKWFTNKSSGIPAYIRIDMATQKTELIRLEQGMKYTPYDHFGRNLYRHLRFRYPSYMFDDINFEIDENGIPWWVCSTKKYTIGLFGGQVIGHVVLCNALTGECEDYEVSRTPSWVDRVYSADLLIKLYDYYGTLKHGYLNSILSQKDCLATTNGYNYLAINDDVWVYTGVTSITSDQSNVGFVLMNQRTMETKYYEVEGAIEDSAMSSAEGKVQNLGYQATFPLLLNIDQEPTYFMALKDASGLVKKYAMVNVHNYQIVATGDSVAETEAAYKALMKQNGIEKPDETKQSSGTLTTTGKIRKIADLVIDGNSHYYLLLEGSDTIYDIDASKNINIILYETGDQVALTYKEGTTACPVIDIEKR